jgi:hypothetical protein
MHTGREGMSAMPYFDDFDLSTVDILLISQYVNPLLSQRCLFSTFGKHLSGLEAVFTKEETKEVAVANKLGLTTSIVSVAQSTNTILFNSSLAPLDLLAMSQKPPMILLFML